MRIQWISMWILFYEKESAIEKRKILIFFLYVKLAWEEKKIQFYLKNLPQINKFDFCKKWPSFKLLSFHIFEHDSVEFWIAS